MNTHSNKPRYLTDDEIQEGMNYWKKHYDDEMAKIFKRIALKDRQVYKWKHNHLLPNLQRCIKCEYSKIVYDESFEACKIECLEGKSLKEMIKDYCITIKTK
jgi:hypothetical protein